MALKINWTTEAEYAYEAILIYLEKKWSVKEVDDFILKTEEFVQVIVQHPYAFQASEFKSVRKAVLTR